MTCVLHLCCHVHPWVERWEGCFSSNMVRSCTHSILHFGHDYSVFRTTGNSHRKTGGSHFLFKGMCTVIIQQSMIYQCAFVMLLWQILSFLVSTFRHINLSQLAQIRFAFDALYHCTNFSRFPLTCVTAIQCEHIFEDCHMAQDGSHKNCPDLLLCLTM